jgi:hypothetical protein
MEAAKEVQLAKRRNKQTSARTTNHQSQTSANHYLTISKSRHTAESNQSAQHLCTT